MEFITNSAKTLIDFLKETKGTKEINILVGYCYYSVFTEIAKEPEVLDIFKNANVKILLGMHIDPYLKYEYSKYEEDEKLSLHEIKEKEEEDFINFSNMETAGNFSGIDIIFSKVKDGSLEIKKTKEDIHAKLYIFVSDDITQVSPGVFITGSSNFTLQGIKLRREFNISENDYKHMEIAKSFFDELWKDENSVNILNVKTYKAIKEKVGLMYMASPYEIFQKVVYEYFEYTNTTKLEYPPSNWGYGNYQYQIDAIKEGVNAVKNYNGVLIADVVGLGKSVVASAVAKNLLEDRFIDCIYIICPPHLITSWENYSENFELREKVKSVGLLENIRKELLEKQRKKYLIIIDEAHNFRNSKTESYAKMKDICLGNKVILLTATPMHNTTSDIFSLIELFDGRLNKELDLESIKSDILKEEKEIRKEYKKDKENERDKETLREMSKKIISHINPVLIRRTRKDLEETIVYKKDLDDQKIKLNNVKDPILFDYTLGDMSFIYLSTLEKISPYEENDKEEINKKEIKKINHFRGVRYKPLCYLKEDSKKAKRVIEEVFGEGGDYNFALTSSKNLSKFMRHLLIRRFESSIGAFRKTIDNLIVKYENICEWMDKGLFPVYKKGDILNVEDFIEYSDMSETDDLDDEDIIEKFEFNKNKKEEYEEKGLYIIENIKEVLEKRFFEDFENDLNILKEIKKDWEKIEEDKKFDELIKCVSNFQKENSKRKIIIFSEFVDTVEYLYEKIEKDNKLKELFKSVKFSSKDKTSKRELIKENFDASVNNENQKDEYFVLITTDTLSEGINLHRAGIVINYDIPYNPTRVIQRVGRINRIGKKMFSSLYICNFLPRIEAQKEIKNWQISNFKLTLINAVLGNDTKILQKEDEIKSLFSIKEERYKEDDLSWDTKYKNIYNKIKESKKLEEKIKNMPHNLFVKRKMYFNGIIQVIRYDKEINAICLKDDIIIYNIANIFELLEASENETYEKPSLEFLEKEKKLKVFRDKRDKNYSHDSILYLEEYKKEIDNMENDENKYYIESLIRFAKEKRFAAYSLNSVVKIFKNPKNINKIDLVKRIIPESLLDKIKNDINDDTNKRRDLIVTEEIGSIEETND